MASGVPDSIARPSKSVQFSSGTWHGVALIVAGVALGVIGVMLPASTVSYAALGASALLLTAEIIRIILLESCKKREGNGVRRTSERPTPATVPTPPAMPQTIVGPISPQQLEWIQRFRRTIFPEPTRPLQSEVSLPLVPFEPVSPPESTLLVDSALVFMPIDAPQLPAVPEPTSLALVPAPAAPATIGTELAVPNANGGWMTTLSGPVAEGVKAFGLAGLALTGQQVGQGVVAVHGPPLVLRFLVARAGGGVTGYLFGFTALGTTMPMVISAGGAVGAAVVPFLARMAVRGGARVCTFVWDAARRSLMAPEDAERGHTTSLETSWVMVVVPEGSSLP